MTRAQRRRLSAAIYATVLVLTPKARAGNREAAVLEVIDQIRADERNELAKRVAGLYDTYRLQEGAGDKRLVSLALGVDYLDRNPRLALQFLSSAELACQTGDPLLLIIRYYVAEAKYRGGAYAEAATIAAELLRTAPGDAWAKQISSLLIESLAASHQDEELVKAFTAYSLRFSFSRRQETLARLAAEALAKEGKAKNEVELLEQLARNYPATAESRWAFNRLQERTCAASPVDRYYFSERLLLHLSQNVVLGTGLEPFIVASIDGPIGGDDGKPKLLSPAEKADFLFRARLYRPALKTVEDLLEAEKAKARSIAVPSLLFELGRIHLRLYEPMVATRYFSDLLFDYPGHQLTTRTLEYMGDALRYAGVPLAAAQSYTEAISHHDSNTLRWMRFWSLYRGKAYKEAMALLDQPGYVLPREGDGMVTVHYWHARLLEKLGRKAEAAPLFAQVLTEAGDSFYGLLVATLHPELAKPAGTTVKPAAGDGDPKGLVMAAKLLAEPEAAIGPLPERPDLQVIDELLKVGLKDVAALQLGALRWQGFDQEESFAAISRLSAALGDYRPSRNLRYTTFTSLRELPKSWQELVQHQAAHADEWKAYYPLAFERIVLPVASRIRLSPFLVLSIMRAESYYNKDARSGVGAQGLMQLMPYTALKIATLLDDQSFDVRDLSKPEINIAYGAYYLDKLLRYYDDNPFLAAAAYNGGPMAVNQWLDSCKDCTADEFVDSIPYRETRGYVREVMRNYAQYVRIYTGRAALGEMPEMPAELPDGEEIF